MRIPFFGAFYTLDSVNADAQSCINLIPEVIESGKGKNIGRLRGTPGLSLFTTLPLSNVLAVWMGEFRMFAVAGTAPSHLYEVFADGTFNDHGSVGNALPLSNAEYAPALLFPNGSQILIINGGFAWVDTGLSIMPPTMTDATYTDLIQDPIYLQNVYSNALPFTAADVGQTLTVTGQGGGGIGTWTPGTYTIVGLNAAGEAILNATAATPGATMGLATETFGQVPAGTGALLDTYGIVAPAAGKFFYITGGVPTAAPGFLNWNSADTAAKEAYPDNILALLADHEILVIFGDLESSELWQDTGAANFPFQRISSGGVIHYGLAAQFSPTRLGFNGVAWLAWSAARGAVQAVYTEGQIPHRISTHAIEQVWRSYPTVRDAIGYSYIEDGHEFWKIDFPSGDATWVYDLTASEQLGTPMWHQRGYWDGTTLHRQLQRSHAYGPLAAHGIAGLLPPAHYVGDRNSGNIYVQDLNNLSDNGQAILRQRAATHMSQENKRAFFSQFQLDLETGNQDISITCDYSKDRGHTYINAHTLAAPAAPDPNAPDVTGFNRRLRWRRLGSAFDFIPRVTTTSIAKISFTDGYLEMEQGTG